MDDTNTAAAPAAGIADPTGTGAMVAGAAQTEIELVESKAEVYSLTHLFGTARGTAFYQVLSGNATVQAAVTSQNIKAVSFLEKLYLKLVEPTLLKALTVAGLA